MQYLIAASASQPAIIALLFFFQFKEFELYWGAVFFTTRREVLEKSFLINFIGLNFEAGNETREKIWCDFVTIKSGQKREWFFVHIAIFQRARK